jgi:hypothetical protein
MSQEVNLGKNCVSWLLIRIPSSLKLEGGNYKRFKIFAHEAQFLLMSEKLHKSYEKALKHHPLGSALYIPVDAKDMYPGCIGVFNTDGHWVNAKWDITATGHEFTPIHQDELQLASRDMRLDVVYSKQISKMEVKVETKASLL